MSLCKKSGGGVNRYIVKGQSRANQDVSIKDWKATITGGTATITSYTGNYPDGTVVVPNPADFRAENHTDVQKVILDVNAVKGLNASKLEHFSISQTNGEKVTAVGDWEKGLAEKKKMLTATLKGLDTSQVTKMMSMFDECSSLTQLDLSGFDTKKVTNMSYMFYDCKELKKLDLSDFETQAVTDMGFMFHNCRNLTQLKLNSDKFTTSNVVIMRNIFNNWSNLITLDISHFDFSKVRNQFAGYDNMFFGFVGELLNEDKISQKNLEYMGFGGLVSATEAPEPNFARVQSKVVEGSGTSGMKVAVSYIDSQTNQEVFKVVDVRSGKWSVSLSKALPEGTPIEVRQKAENKRWSKPIRLIAGKSMADIETVNLPTEKVKVDDKNHPTKEEKEQVIAKFKEANKSNDKFSTVKIADDGSITVVFSDGSEKKLVQKLSDFIISDNIDDIRKEAVKKINDLDHLPQEEKDKAIQTINETLEKNIIDQTVAEATLKDSKLGAEKAISKLSNLTDERKFAFKTEVNEQSAINSVQDVVNKAKEEDAKNLDDEKNRVNDRIKQAKTDNLVTDADVSAIQEQITKAATIDQVKDAEKELLEVLSKKSKDYAKKLKTLKEGKDKLEKQINDLDAKVKDLESKLSEANTGNSDKQNEINDLKKQLQNTKNELENLKKTKDQTVKDKQKEVENLNKQVTELEGQINELKQEKDDLTKENSDLKEQVKDLNNKVADLKEKLGEAKTTDTTNKQEIGRLKKELKETKEQVDQVKKDKESSIGEKQKMIDGLNEKVSELEKKVQNLTEKNQELDKKNKDLTTEKTQLEGLTAKVKELEESLKIAQIQDGEKAEKIKSLEKELVDTKKKLEEADNKNPDSDNLAKIAELTREIAALNDQVTKLSQQNADLNKQIQDLEAQDHSCPGEDEQGNSEVKRLRDELHQVRQELVDSKSLGVEKQKKIGELEHQNAELAQKVAELTEANKGNSQSENFLRSAQDFANEQIDRAKENKQIDDKQAQTLQATVGLATSPEAIDGVLNKLDQLIKEKDSEVLRSTQSRASKQFDQAEKTKQVAKDKLSKIKERVNGSTALGDMIQALTDWSQMLLSSESKPGSGTGAETGTGTTPSGETKPSDNPGETSKPGGDQGGTESGSHSGTEKPDNNSGNTRPGNEKPGKDTGSQTPDTGKQTLDQDKSDALAKIDQAVKDKQLSADQAEKMKAKIDGATTKEAVIEALKELTQTEQNQISESSGQAKQNKKLPKSGQAPSYTYAGIALLGMGVGTMIWKKERKKN